jgi:phage-related minor tail protein
LTGGEKVAKIKGITIEIAGNTQPLNKALEDVNKKSRDLQGELRQVDRLLKLDPSNTTLLAQKQKLLAEAVENSKEKLDRLKTAQEQVNEQFRKGEITRNSTGPSSEVVKAEQELSKFEKQLRETGLLLSKVGKKLQDAGQKMTDVGKKMSTYVTAPIVAAGAASFKMAADLQDALGATDQIFKGAADSVKNWADNLESYYGIAEGEALEYANMMGTMLVNIGGLTEEQAAKQAQLWLSLPGDLTAMYGGTTADAVRALTGAFKGNNTMLDNYGMAANDAMIKTKALEMGLYDGTGQMDLATKQAATLALIMEQTGAAQGQAAREAEGASGGMRAFATEIKNLATDIGEVLLPVITPLLASLGEIVKKFSELSPETQKIIVAIAGVAAAIGPLLVVLGAMSSGISAIIGILPVLGTAFTVLTGPIGLVVAAIAGLIGIGVLLYKNWDEIKAKAAEIWTAISNFFKETWGNIRQTAENIWNGIKDFFKKWGDEILLIAAGPAGWAVLLGRKIAENWDKIKAKAEDIWSNLKSWLDRTWNDIETTAGRVWGNIKESILSPIRSAKDTVFGIIDSIKNAFANLKIEIPKPKLPHISVNWKSVGIGNAKVSIPDFDINWYRTGGIFRNPAIIGVGEAGTEAVIPLDKLPGLISDALRDALGGRGALASAGVVVQNMYVRDDQDIVKIARELYNLQQRTARGRGLK